MWQYNNSNELYHYGVQGMKWGNRKTRFYNSDGSMTKSGRSKYRKIQQKELNKLDSERAMMVGNRRIYDNQSERLTKKLNKATAKNKTKKIEKINTKLYSVKRKIDEFNTNAKKNYDKTQSILKAMDEQGYTVKTALTSRAVMTGKQRALNFLGAFAAAQISGIGFYQDPHELGIQYKVSDKKQNGNKNNADTKK